MICRGDSSRASVTPAAQRIGKQQRPSPQTRAASIDAARRPSSAARSPSSAFRALRGCARLRRLRTLRAAASRQDAGLTLAIKKLKRTTANPWRRRAAAASPCCDPPVAAGACAADEHGMLVDLPRAHSRVFSALAAMRPCSAPPRRVLFERALLSQLWSRVPCDLGPAGELGVIDLGELGNGKSPVGSMSAAGSGFSPLWIAFTARR